MAAPRKYSLELRERAVRMYHPAEPKPQIKWLAADLGVHPEALRGWIRQAEADAGERNDRPTTAEREEFAALRKENTQLKRANEILRTASAFSPRSSTRPGPGDGAPRRAPASGSRARTPGTAHRLRHCSRGQFTGHRLTLSPPEHDHRQFPQDRKSWARRLGRYIGGVGRCGLVGSCTARTLRSVCGVT